MKITEIKTIDVFKNLYDIEADDEVKYFSFPNFETKELEMIDYKSAYEEYENNDKKKMYVVIQDDKVIGGFSFIRDFMFLINKPDNVAWISIGFKKDYFGNSMIKESYIHFEQILRNNGFKKIELGVFAFNERAIRFYEKMGYRKLMVIENFTYYDNKWWDDIRYEKEL